MVKVLCTLADDPGEVDRLGRNARSILLEKYSTGHLAIQYHSTLMEAAHGGQSDRSLSVELETFSGKG